jgi:hypothetical protein
MSVELGAFEQGRKLEVQLKKLRDRLKVMD